MWRFFVRVFLVVLFLNISLLAEYTINEEDKKLLTQYKQNYKKSKKNKHYKKAINYLFKIIDLEKKNNQDNNIIASKYNDIAGLYKRLKEYHKSLNFYQKDLNLTILTMGKNSLYTAISYNSLGKLYRTMKEYDKSLDSFQEALTINQKVFGKNHPFTAIVYKNMASIYEKMRNYTKALLFYEKSLNIQKLEKPSLTLAITYNNMGLIYSEQEQYAKALKFHQKALNMKEKLLPKIHPSLSKTYNNLGTVHQERGAYKKALAYYKKALSFSLSPTIYNNIARLYMNMGEYNKALNYYEQALTLSKTTLAKHPNLKATLYNNIATVYTNNKKYEKALNYYEKTLTLLSKNHPFVADTYSNIGLTYSYMKNYTKALRYYHKSINFKENKLTQNRSSLATIYNNIGLVHKSKGEYVEALKYMQKALEMKEKLFDKEHPSIVISYESMASVYNANSDYDKAYFYSNKAFKTFLLNRNKNSMILNHQEKRNYLIDNLPFLELFFISGNRYVKSLKNNQIKLQKTKENIFNNWLNYKGTLFEYQNILSMVKYNPKTPQKVIESINNLNLLNKKLSNTKNPIEAKKIEEKIHSIEIKLSQHNDKLKNMLQLNDLNSSQIASELKPHQLYIDFAKGNDNYYVFTIDASAKLSFQQISQQESKAIDSNITAYRYNTNMMAKYIDQGRLKKHLKILKEEANRVLKNLYSLLIEKHLNSYIKDKKHLIISPDGLLNYFPFEALYHEKSYLIEHHNISYISSGKEFMRQTKIMPKQPKEEIILFANADFSAKLKNLPQKSIPIMFGNPKKIKLEKLFEALGRGEIDVIKRYYTHPLVFEKEDANIKNLMSISSSKILHLSTHGLFLKDKSISNPMQKSVLIFAGGNENLEASSLSALQLSTLDLKETELVILSACQSGLGDIQNAEGIVGLPKALLQAGAKNVIMSLWVVSNKETTRLMAYFYANLTKKQSYATALQNAKIEMIDKHPYYWSSFILSGLTQEIPNDKNH